MDARMIQYMLINVIYYVTRIKNKIYDHLNRYTKTFDKIQWPFMMKTLNKLGIRLYFNIIKGIYGKSTLHIILAKDKLKVFPQH
jgi:hypothetical protein